MLYVDHDPSLLYLYTGSKMIQPFYYALLQTGKSPRAVYGEIGSVANGKGLRSLPWLSF